MSLIPEHIIPESLMKNEMSDVFMIVFPSLNILILSPSTLSIFNAGFGATTGTAAGTAGFETAAGIKGGTGFGFGVSSVIQKTKVNLLFHGPGVLDNPTHRLRPGGLLSFCPNSISELTGGEIPAC